MKIIKFETASCGPCKMVDMMLKDKGLAVDEKVDIEVHEDIRAKYDIMKAPTVLLVDDNGVELGRVIGINEEGILDLFARAGRI